jgi:hypothetical protein
MRRAPNGLSAKDGAERGGARGADGQEVFQNTGEEQECTVVGVVRQVSPENRWLLEALFNHTLLHTACLPGPQKF